MKINFSRSSRIFPSWHSLLYTEKHLLVQCTYFAVRRWEGLKWLIQRKDEEQREKGPNEWVEEVLNGIRGTCIVFWRHRDDLLLLSRCIRSVLQLYFVFLSIFLAFVFCTLETRWLAHLLSESSDSNYHLLSPNNPTIKKREYYGKSFVIHLPRNVSCLVLI